MRGHGIFNSVQRKRTYSAAALNAERACGDSARLTNGEHRGVGDAAGARIQAGPSGAAAARIDFHQFGARGTKTPSRATTAQHAIQRSVQRVAPSDCRGSKPRNTSAPMSNGVCQTPLASAYDEALLADSAERIGFAVDHRRSAPVSTSRAAFAGRVSTAMSQFSPIDEIRAEFHRQSDIIAKVRGDAALLHARVDQHRDAAQGEQIANCSGVTATRSSSPTMSAISIAVSARWPSMPSITARSSNKAS